MVTGQLFSFRGDLTRLRSDAWLLPTDGRLRVAPHLRPSVRSRLTAMHDLRVQPPTGWRVGGEARTFRLPQRAGSDAPAIWPTLVQRDRPGDDAWYVDGVRSFLEQAVAALPRDDRRARRPLLAVPFVGPAPTPRRPVAPGLVQELVALLRSFLAAHPGIDLAVVCRSDRELAAIRWARKAEREPLPRPIAPLVRHAQREGLLVVVGPEADGAALAARRHDELRSALVAGLPTPQLVAVPPCDGLVAAVGSSGAVRVLPAPEDRLRAAVHATAQGRHVLLVGFHGDDRRLRAVLDAARDDAPDHGHPASALVTAGVDPGRWPEGIDRVAVPDVDAALDRIALEAADSSGFLLDPAMAPLLGPAEQHLARAVRGVVHAFGATDGGDARLGLERVLRGLGWDGTTPVPERDPAR